MNEPLFREEAIRELSALHLDSRRLRAPAPLLGLSVALFLALALALSFIGTTTYARKHLVAGQLDQTSTTAFHASDFGHLSQLGIREGEFVTRGQALGRITYRKDGRDESSAGELQQQLLRLQESIDETNQSAEAKLSALRDQERGVEQRLSITGQDLLLQTSKVEEMQAQVNRTATLRQQGYLSNLDWLGFQTNLTDQKQQLFRLQGQQVELRQLQQDVRHQMNTVRASRSQQLIELALNRSRIRDALAQVRANPYQLLTATHDGVVSRIEVFEGGTVTPGQAILYLNDESLATTATLLVPPVATRHLHIGDELALEMEAFPLETFGHIQAEVERIPRHTINSGQQPAYPVRVRIIPSDRIGVYLPGMTVSGFITAERKTLLQWLISPITRMADSFQ